MYTYNEAFTQSREYFNGDELAAKVFVDKYALRDKQQNILECSPEQMHRRLAKEFARIEANKFDTPLSEDEIFALFDKFKYIIPQGSPMYGIGNNYQIVSLSNCYVLDAPLDSYSSILKVDEQLVNISKRRGGVGISLSNLRPAGAATNNAARTSTGIVTWMERYSNSIREVGQAGRRGALLLALDIRHPDIEQFITIKKDTTKVTGANVSVQLTKDFIQKVKADEEFTLQWPVESDNPQITRTVRAKDLWDLMIEHAHDMAEPGILAWDNFLENGPADQYDRYRSVATNPCSELSLPSLDSCRLMAMNLLSYVDNAFTEDAVFNYETFGKDVRLAQRLMDDLVDLESEKINQILTKINSDPEPEDVKRSERELWQRIKLLNDEGRRTGLGITALGDTLAALDIKYGSEDSIHIVGKIYQQLKLHAYRSSVEMARELGSFKEYDPSVEAQCPFIQRIKDEDINLYNDMVQYGRRNVAILTTAPTGSVSILTQTSSGIEPVFQLSYTRRKKINPNDKEARTDFIDQNGDHWQEFKVYHNRYDAWLTNHPDKKPEDSPWFGATANDINWINRVKLQAEAQKHVCHSISSTINLPNDVSKETVAEIYDTAFALGCKGITVYRDGCRSGVLVTDKEEEKNVILKHDAPKRPAQLKAEVFHVNKDGKPYIIIIGLLEEEPYEVFIMENDEDGEKIIPKVVNEGIIEKIKSGKYILHYPNKEWTWKISDYMGENSEALTRMASLSLRHGASIEFLVEQLEKTKGDLFTLAKILCRALKKYIQDGTKTQEHCPECGSDLVRSEGCKSCTSCSYSKCG